MIETPSAVELTPYYCTGFNADTRRPCTAEVISAWAPAGALVRRRCKQCGTWQLITVRPADAAASPLHVVS